MRTFKGMVAGAALILPGLLWAQYPIPLPPEYHIYPSAPQTKELPGAPHAINRTSKILGMSILNPGNEKLGTVRDLAVDFKSQQVAYAWIEKKDATGESSKYVAVPLELLSPSKNQRHLILNVEKSQFDNAQGYAANQLPNMALAPGYMAYWRTITEAAGAQPAERK